MIFSLKESALKASVIPVIIQQLSNASMANYIPKMAFEEGYN